ncbi:acyltransferase family protein [Nicoliella lavandulae]|uniref:Acyltransferase family protein n=1 Tax=Nicoliella lavandulae TaxID=3082954 RepID=A0ABU8SLZ2_9LACO
MQNKNSRQNSSRRYITGLDGIRAIAVIAVIIFHLLPYSIKGGYLGVSMFFSVSGYLITDLLMQEWERNKRISLKNFYYRRMRRLYPALVVMVFATGTYITLFQRNLLTNLRVTIWTNLLYVYNWWEIGHGQSYFDRFQGESPFTHLWSLSIEAQYYLIWPILLIILLKILRSRRRILYLLVPLSALATIWMTMVYHSTSNINRVYYGTDTRMFSILFGVTLAILLPSNHFKKFLRPVINPILTWLGILSMGGIIYLLFSLSGQAAATYNWGMGAISLLTVILIATCVNPNTSVNRLLTNPIFRWIGTRSYGIYLYQFPVMIFYEAKVLTIGAHPVANAIIEIAIILIISEISYRWIESPLRHFNFNLKAQDIASLFKANSKYGKKRLLLIPLTVLVVITAVGATQEPSQAEPKHSLKRTIQKNEALIKAKNDKTKFTQADDSKKESVKKDKKIKLTRAERSIAKQYQLSHNQVLTARKMPLTAIGDSVMADSSVDLQKVFTNSYVSAQVGRQIWQAPDVIDELKQQQRLASNVLINLGTNSPMNDEQLKTVIHKIGHNRQIYWINVHVPTMYWEGEVNMTLAKAAKKYHNLHIIDWHSYSKNKPQLFWDDHVHPNPVGNQKYVGLITRSIIK